MDFCFGGVAGEFEFDDFSYASRGHCAESVMMNGGPNGHALRIEHGLLWHNDDLDFHRREKLGSGRKRESVKEWRGRFFPICGGLSRKGWGVRIWRGGGDGIGG